jgi:hypothetical protein
MMSFEKLSFQLFSESTAFIALAQQYRQHGKIRHIQEFRNPLSYGMPFMVHAVLAVLG